MESESSDAWRLPWIWFLECLAANKQVDYRTLRDVARKVPGLSGSAAMNARELLALRCLEGLAEVGNEASGAARCGSKFGLDLSQRCSVVLFRLTSEVVKSNSGLDGLDVSKRDIRAYVEHKRAELPKCSLERLEEMIMEGKDPAAVSLWKICGIENVDYGDYMDVCEGTAKVVSLACDESSHHRHVEAGIQQVMHSIPENEEGSCQDGSKNGDVHLIVEKSVEHMQATDNKEHIVSDIGDKVTYKGQLTSPLKEDGSDSSTKHQAPCINTAHFSEKSGFYDQHVHTSRNNQKRSSATSQGPVAHTVLGEEFREEIKSSAELDAPATANCNQQQAVLPVADQTNTTASARNQNYYDGLVSESVVETSLDNLEKKREPSDVKDNPFDAEGYDNDDVNAASLKNNFMSSQCTALDWTEPALCMKCSKSGPLLCCSASACSVTVHRDCLGVEPCFDDSESFRCPFCASSLATAKYFEAKGRATIRKRELDVYLSSSLSSKLSQRILNKKKRRHSIQDSMPNPMKGHEDEEKAETNCNQPNQNVDNRDHISPEICGDADVNATHESLAACMGSDLPDRGHGDIGTVVERPILQVKDMLPPRGKNKTTDHTTCQPLCAFTQPPLPSEESEHQNSYAIVLYEGGKGYDKKATASQNPSESKIKHVRAIRNTPKIMYSKATSNVPYQSYPAYRRRKVPWTADEEHILREGVKTFHTPEEGGVIPWAKILEFGALVFQPCRTAENLKDKWRNICKKEK